MTIEEAVKFCDAHPIPSIVSEAYRQTRADVNRWQARAGKAEKERDEAIKKYHDEIHHGRIACEDFLAEVNKEIESWKLAAQTHAIARDKYKSELEESKKIFWLAQVQMADIVNDIKSALAASATKQEGTR